METTIRDALKASDSVKALAGTRVDWGVRPEGKALPAITLNLVDDVADRHLNGESGVTMSRVQLVCWAADYKTARALEIAAKAALIRLRTAPVRVIHFDTMRTGSDTTPGQIIHRRSRDLLVWHKA